ncbi:MAG TPA: DUF447 domain-containing protein [Methanocellaceae archaeon]
MDEIFKEGITEVVVTSISKSGEPNAAPMGVVRHGDRYFIRMFPNTTTLKNVGETGYLVANVTTDPLVYVISAFENLGSDYFINEKDMTVPRLKGAAAWVYCKCSVSEYVAIEPISSEVVERVVPVFSRAFPAIIEATIVGTRLRFYKGNEGEKKIHEYESIVRKCGSPRELEAMKKLKEILNL